MESDAVAALKSSIVLANHILLHHQVLDGFGHVSARHPERPDRFLLAKRMAPGLVTEGDILDFGLDGEPAEDGGEPTFLERFIHSELYKARPDVQAVVHSHAPTMVAVGLVRENPLRAVCHTCGFLGTGVPLFEIRDTAGDATNLLITNRALGAALADSLGDAAIVLMRGHGFTAIGPSVAHAVYRAVYAEINARIQTGAAQLGTIVPMTRAEADAAEETADLQVERNWAFWRDLVQA
ncbi:MAG TPA: class II aldolase/adducin family protein [Allosphingosinicella sp.]|nr:class II aldolase/adducin family protein [Allosphingosinicella sp.]